MKSKLRAIVVDDECLARDRIRNLLQTDPQVEVVGECSNGLEAVNAIKKEKPDLLFLDIQMPLMDGFTLLKKLTTHIPEVIFITAFDEYAVKAFEVNALDYILKPFTRKRFAEAVRRVKDRVGHSQKSDFPERLEALLQALESKRNYPERLAIKNNGVLMLLKIAEIDWIESDDNYIRVHSGKDTHMVRETIGAIERRLDPCQFIRIHRRIIVNINRIRQVHPWFHRSYCIVLQDGTKLPVGRNYKDKIKSIPRTI